MSRHRVLVDTCGSAAAKSNTFKARRCSVSFFFMSRKGDFPVVCVGGPAGSLSAYAELLRHLPTDLGVAIVIVNHLRTVATRLHLILPRYTPMPVELITEELLIQPNRVYIIPENRDLHVHQGAFRLTPLSKPYGWPDVITRHLSLLGASPVRQSHRGHRLWVRYRRLSRSMQNQRSGRADDYGISQLRKEPRVISRLRAGSVRAFWNTAFAHKNLAGSKLLQWRLFENLEPPPSID